MNDYKAHNPPNWLDVLFLLAIGALIVIDWPAIVGGLRDAGVIR